MKDLSGVTNHERHTQTFFPVISGIVFARKRRPRFGLQAGTRRPAPRLRLKLQMPVHSLELALSPCLGDAGFGSFTPRAPSSRLRFGLADVLPDATSTQDMRHPLCFGGLDGRQTGRML
jgi:hypothetical protein